jgi:hypothetical protein
MASRSTRPPDRDLLLANVGALRDLVKQLGRDATWRFTLACAFAWASQQLPMPTDNAVTRARLLLAAVELGALIGKRLDRRKRREPRDAAAVAADLVGEVLPAGELAPGRHGPGSSTHPARWQGAGCVPQPPAWMESHRACVPRGHTRKATNCRRQSELGRQLAGVDYLGLAAAAELAGVDQGEDLELGDPARRVTTPAVRVQLSCS